MRFLRKRIGRRIAFFVGLILIPVLGGFFYLDIRLQSLELIGRTKEEVLRLSDAIERSVKCDMLKADRKAIQEIIETIGGQPGIEKVRIFNKEGRTIVAADRSSVGEVVDKKAEACYSCHRKGEKLTELSISETTRIYSMGEKKRVLGVINPIYNEEPCHRCHDREKRVLGVLDIVVSLEQVDHQISQRRRRAFGFAISLLLFLSGGIGLYIFHSINRPIRELVTGTRRISEGNLDHKIPLEREDEIGELASSFNRMTSELKKSRGKIEGWSRELESRVKEATAELEAANKELQEANRRLKKLDEAKSEAVMTVAHELKAPLSSIWSLLKTVTRGYTQEVPLRQREVIKRAERRTRWLLTLVRDLLDFARMETGQVELEAVPVNLDETIERIVKLFTPRAQEAETTIRVVKSKSAAKVLGNEDALERVFTNLVSNAIRYNRPGGSVTIREELLGENVRVEVSDNGVGIPEADIPQLFDLFYRGSYARSQKMDGAGLGLSIVKRIVELHHGKIWVKSKEGKGSIFYVLLPAAEGKVT
ncbi:MAG: ATP-binding protein [bacterium]